MSKQRESLWVADPMTDHLGAMKWFTQNIHGNMHTSGLPDLYIAQKGRMDRWVEFKVIESNGSIKFTPAQLEKFPLMIAQGARIYIICSRKPLRNDYLERNRLYEKILGEPNGKFMVLGKAFYHMLY